MLRRARQARPDVPWRLLALALALIAITAIAAMVAIVALTQAKVPAANGVVLR